MLLVVIVVFGNSIDGLMNIGLGKRGLGNEIGRLTLSRTSISTSRTTGARVATLVGSRLITSRVLSMSLDVLLEILRTLEGLLAGVALVRLEWNMDTDVRSDVIALDSSRVAVDPSTSQVKIVGGLAADMTLTHVLLLDSKLAWFRGDGQTEDTKGARDLSKRGKNG
jgi:hypothetical protein